MLIHCWCEGKMVQLLWKIVWQFFYEVKDIYRIISLPKEMQMNVHKNISTQMFLNNNPVLETTQTP
jgi:hypothetical protein